MMIMVIIIFIIIVVVKLTKCKIILTIVMFWNQIDCWTLDFFSYVDLLIY
jgi:hypothetical protein